MNRLSLNKEIKQPEEHRLEFEEALSKREELTKTVPKSIILSL